MGGQDDLKWAPGALERGIFRVIGKTMRHAAYSPTAPTIRCRE